jgi:Arc/MetJ-type ribon-helix-helix transcriptional regulator
LDRLVAEARFPSRSRAVQEAIRDKLDRLGRGRLARECAQLDPGAERRLADEGLAADLELWPEY